MTGTEKSERDAAFLAQEFDMPATDAAALVSGKPRDDDQTQALADTVREARDPLEGTPTPEPSPEQFIADSDEDALKPVLSRRNDRLGAG